MLPPGSNVRTVARAAASLALILLASPALAAHAALRSPWDLLSIQQTSTPYTCPAAVPLPRDIVAYDYYTDKRYSIPDPARFRAYQQAAAPFRRTMTDASRAADFYVKSGSRSAALCVLQILVADARSGAMTGAMASNQSYYVQNWTVGALAIAYLKVRDSAAGTAAERSQIAGWLIQVAHSTQNYFGARRAEHTKDARNNHLYWAGLAVMAAGIAADNRNFYNWGLGTYRDGVDQIAPDGTLPLEMARGRRALHYHLFAAAPLVTMAEFGEANGQDLYAIDHAALHRLVNRCVSGLQDNSWFAAKTSFRQGEPGPRLLSSDVAWMRPYEQRFPDPAIRQLLSRVSSMEYNFLGGNPPPVVRPAEARPNRVPDTGADKRQSVPAPPSTP